jgi:hypothetical protein
MKEYSAKFSNFIVAFATLSHHKAQRFSFIPLLCDVLAEKDLTNSKTMLDLLNEVSKRVKQGTMRAAEKKYAQTTETKILGPMEKPWYLPYQA